MAIINKIETKLNTYRTDVVEEGNDFWNWLIMTTHHIDESMSESSNTEQQCSSDDSSRTDNSASLFG